MIGYVIYTIFILFLIYFINKFIKFILNKTNNNLLLKKDLLEHRENYKKQINQFNKLFNDIKILTEENNKLENDYIKLRQNNYEIDKYCNTLKNTLGDVDKDIIELYKEQIIPIYSNHTPAKLTVDETSLDKNKKITLEYYKNLRRS